MKPPTLYLHRDVLDRIDRADRRFGLRGWRRLKLGGGAVVGRTRKPLTRPELTVTARAALDVRCTSCVLAGIVCAHEGART